MKYNKDNFDDETKSPFDRNDRNSFGLPSDYFLSFEDKIKKRLELEQELDEFPLLSGINKRNTFLVPENYFLTQENRLEYISELSPYLKLSLIKKPVAAELDNDFTQSLKESIGYKITLAEELKAYSNLDNIDKENVFLIPENYFEGLALRIKDKLLIGKKSSVSILDRLVDLLFGRKIALSFAFLSILMFSVFIYRISKKNIPVQSCQTIACLEKQDILNNTSFIGFEEEELMDLVDVKGLSKQLQHEVKQTDSLQQEDFILENIDTPQLLEEL